MRTQAIATGLTLLLAPVPALVAHAEDSAAGAVRDAARAVGGAVGAEQAAQKAEDKAKAAADALNKHLPTYAAAGMQLEKAKEKAKSGNQEDLDNLKTAQEKFDRISAVHSRLQQEAITRSQEAETAKARAAAAGKAADDAIAAAQMAIDQMENKPIEKRDLQRALDAIKARRAKR